jgi:carotenoid cleavage dioxygenase
MANRFPDTPTFTGLNTPCRVEGVIRDLEFDGQLPAALRGTFYRAGPDPRFPPLLGDDININGDGMAAMFRFEPGTSISVAGMWRPSGSGSSPWRTAALFMPQPYERPVGHAGRDRTTANTASVSRRAIVRAEGGRPAA